MENQKWSKVIQKSVTCTTFGSLPSSLMLCVFVHKISMETLEDIHANNMIMNCIYIVTLVTKAK